MRRSALLLSLAIALPLAVRADQPPQVQVQPPKLEGSRPLEAQTASAVVRDYLQSWQTLSAALNQNQAALLDQDFSGTAHDKLAETIAEQSTLGIHTRYLNSTHQLQIVFYSPDGLSLQMIDNAAYDEQVLRGDQVLATHHVRARYIVVLTPAQVRWMVRIFEAGPPQEAGPQPQT